MSRLSRLPQRSLRRTSRLGLAALLLIVSLAGCAGNAATPTPTPTPSPSPTATPSPTPSPSPSPSPTITVGYSQTATGIAYVATDGTSLNVPEIPGLVASLADGKVSYAALASNPYGLKADTIGAYFNPLVSVGGKQVGGIALEAHVAAGYLKTATATHGVISPVDFRSVTGAVSFDSGIFKVTHKVLTVTFGGTATVTDILPGTRSFTFPVNPTYGIGCYDTNSEPGASGDQWAYLKYFAPGLTESSTPTKYSLGQKVGETSGPVTIAYADTKGITDLEPASSLVRIGNSPVSVFQQGS